MAEIFGNPTTTPLNPNAFSSEVDQTYNPESENAQSGKAVAEAVTEKEQYIFDVLRENYATKKYVDDAISHIETPEASSNEIWEQIDDFTLTEQAVVSITEDSNGNPISLKKFKVVVILPAVSTATTLHLKLNKFYAIATQASSATATKPSYSISAEYTFDWQFLTSINNSNAYSNAAIYSTPYGHRYANEATSFPCNLIGLALNSQFTNGLPEGARIRIWGVRA